MREKPAQSAQRRVVSFRLGPCSSTVTLRPRTAVCIQSTRRLGSFWNGWTIIGRTRITQLVQGLASADLLASVDCDRGWLRLGGCPYAHHHAATVWNAPSGLNSAS